MKFRKTEQKIKGWNILFKNNVHMYCHQLTVTKGNISISIPCEDLPRTTKTMGIWLEDIKQSEEVKKELKNLLSEWCKELDTETEIYLDLKIKNTNH